MNNNWFCLLIHQFDCICFTIKSSVYFELPESLITSSFKTKFWIFCKYRFGNDTHVLLCILFTISELCTTSTFCRLSSVILFAFNSAGLDILNIVHKTKTPRNLEDIHCLPVINDANCLKMSLKCFQTIANILSSVSNSARYQRISEDEECDLLWSGDLLPCAYLRTAAVLTCLHIPMQLNIAYFSFSALAPSLPAFPFHPHRAMNADKRYPLAWLLPCVSESKNSVNTDRKDRDYLGR